MEISKIDYKTLPEAVRQAAKLACIEDMRSGKYTVQELAARYGTTRVTIYSWKEQAEEGNTQRKKTGRKAKPVQIASLAEPRPKAKARK